MFYLAGFIESWGRGIEKICDACVKDKLPVPEFTVNPENADGSVIEFMGMSAEGLSEYSIVEIIVYDGEISTAGGN